MSHDIGSLKAKFARHRRQMIMLNALRPTMLPERLDRLELALKMERAALETAMQALQQAEPRSHKGISFPALPAIPVHPRATAGRLGIVAEVGARVAGRLNATTLQNRPASGR